MRLRTEGHVAIAAALAIVACSEVRWTDEKRVPEDADEVIVRLLRTAERARGDEMADDYDEAIGPLWSETERHAYARVASDLPAIRARAEPDGFDDDMFDRAPRLAAQELARRAGAFTRELERLQARYEAYVTPHVACDRRLAERIAEIRTALANMNGDLSVTTGPLHRFLWKQGYPTHYRSITDRGTVAERRPCPPPP